MPVKVMLPSIADYTNITVAAFPISLFWFGPNRQIIELSADETNTFLRSLDD